MKESTVLKSLKIMAAGAAVVSAVTPVNASIVKEAIDAPADTTRVIDIEEVVVIATPKENNRLRQQPISATSFSQGDMRNNSVTSVKSLSGLVPNLFIPDYGSKLTTSVYVRGIGSRINTPAVGLYVDNIPFIDKSAFDFNYSDIERIDVLRGPQGTLYGRNTMGGLIRVFTKSPFSYQGTDISLGAATYNNYKASVNHYHRISDKFAFSAGAFYEHEGGFFENTARNNEKIDKSDEVGGRMRAIWLPKDNLKLDLTVNYEYSNQGGYPYQLTSISETDIYYQDLKGDLGKVAYNNECGYMRHLLNGGLNLEYQAENFILSSVTGFQYLKDEMNLDQDFTSQWLNTEGPVTFHEDGIQNLIEDNINSIFPSGNPKAPEMKVDIASNQIHVPGIFDTPTLNSAVYHQSTINDLLVEGLSLTVGIRLDYEKIKMNYNSSTNMPFNFLFKMGSMPIEVKDLKALSTFEGGLSTDYLQVLPKFSLQYSWNKMNNVYATISKGYRSGGYNIQMFSEIIQGSLRNSMIDAVANTEEFSKFAGMLENFKKDGVNIKDATLYKPEYSWNYEIGSHMTMFDGRLQADVAAFYMDTHDQQISRFAASGLGRITVNAGKSRSNKRQLWIYTRHIY